MRAVSGATILLRTMAMSDRVMKRRGGQKASIGNYGEGLVGLFSPEKSEARQSVHRQASVSGRATIQNNETPCCSREGYPGG